MAVSLVFSIKRAKGGGGTTLGRLWLRHFQVRPDRRPLSCPSDIPSGRKCKTVKPATTKPNAKALGTPQAVLSKNSQNHAK
jgi:hypothetical protein